MKPFAFFATFIALYLLPCRAARAAELRAPATALTQSPAQLGAAPAKASAPQIPWVAPAFSLAGQPPAAGSLPAHASRPRPRARARLFRSGLSPPV